MCDFAQCWDRYGDMEGKSTKPLDQKSYNTQQNSNQAKRQLKQLCSLPMDTKSFYINITLCLLFPSTSNQVAWNSYTNHSYTWDKNLKTTIKIQVCMCVCVCGVTYYFILIYWKLLIRLAMTRLARRMEHRTHFPF